MLVKTSAIFLLPALAAYTVAANRSETAARARKLGLAVVLVFGSLFAAYALAALLSHGADVDALGRENGMTLQFRSLGKLIRVFYRGATWVDPLLFPLAMISAGAPLVWLPSLRREPLLILSVWWIAGYTVFMVLHFSADPRYFLLFVVPVVLLVLLLWRELESVRPQALLWCTAALVWLSFGSGVVEITRHLLHPTYEMRDAYGAVAKQIRARGDPHPVVFGHGAMQSTLFTGIESFDDIGSMPLGEKLDRYHPGWIVTWSDGVGITRNPDVLARFRTVPAGRWTALDQPGRAQLLLFRLQPKQTIIP